MSSSEDYDFKIGDIVKGLKHEEVADNQGFTLGVQQELERCLFRVINVNDRKICIKPVIPSTYFNYTRRDQDGEWFTKRRFRKI